MFKSLRQEHVEYHKSFNIVHSTSHSSKFSSKSIEFILAPFPKSSKRKASIRLPGMLPHKSRQVQASRMFVSSSMLLQCAQLLPLSAHLY